MKLYLITDSSQQTTTDLLVQACKSRDVEPVILYPKTTHPLDLHPTPRDAVYRIATFHVYGATELMQLLISQGATSFYRDPTFIPTPGRPDDLIYAQHDVPIPQTIPYIPQDRAVLDDCVQRLGGFPIILKALGGSHGVGVMRVDSSQSLYSVADYLRQQPGRAVMKQYCDVTSTARLIVLGDQVIDSIQYTAPAGDFRSNEGAQPNVSARQFDDDINDVAVRAVHALGLEFGGVDIMLTPDGPKIAEVNCPCYFPRCQLLTGTDIAGQMVDYLKRKAEIRTA